MIRINSQMRGIYRDVLQDCDKGVVFDSGWSNNTIVDQCRQLLAGFVGRGSSDGITYLAVGQGDPDWDDFGIPSTDAGTTTALVNQYTPEIFHDVLEFTFLDENEHPTQGPTSRLEVSAVLPPQYPQPVEGMTTYPLREFGLFAELNGVSYMINNIRHPVIHKGMNATLIRTVRLFF